MKSGLFYAIAAYLLWGLLPVFWKTLREVPSFEILCHRIVWSLVFLLILSLNKKHWRWIQKAVHQPVILFPFIATACLLSVNWFTYIWAVNSGFIVESSLGYFINPLFSVLLGVLLLKEKLRSWQWISVGIAACGMIYLTITYGHFPWIALVLAVTFGLYGFIRKTAALEALEGLTFETAFLFLPALLMLFIIGSKGMGSFGHISMKITLLLAGTGIATALPLLFFTRGVRRIPLTHIGILQYIAPILQFLIGVLIYHEDFSKHRIIGFICIWTALLIFSIEGIITRNKSKHTLNKVGV